MDARQESPAVEVRLRFRGEDPGLAHRLDGAQRIASDRGMACRLEIDITGASTVSLVIRRGEPLSVLVVEDNAGAVELYRRYLSAAGWLVRGVSDPRIAVSVAKETTPDVLLLDVMMPWLDGWSVLAQLRADPQTVGLPVVICSVVQQPELATALGAHGYLTKPVSQAELLACLRNVLGRPSPSPG